LVKEGDENPVTVLMFVIFLF